jgi:hypothetical protein
MTSRDHGSSLDTLRWGDAETLLGLETLAGVETTFISSKQLAQAHWRWPLSWSFWAMFVPMFDSTERSTFTVITSVTLGVGQAQLTTEIRTDLPHDAANLYHPVNLAETFPGQDIQVRCRVTGQATLTNPNGVNSLAIGVFLAPQTEPHAMTEILARLEGEPKEQVEWMREGFTPQELHYRR